MDKEDLSKAKFKSAIASTVKAVSGKLDLETLQLIQSHYNEILT